ncbi:MAG: GyrI-like domain-containing protein [Proteobacteria bacterium]|nr:GyrI-like domain-containing protein [Pseudomonadota bacterium]
MAGETDANGYGTAEIIAAVRAGTLEPVERGAGWAIFPVQVKHYPASAFLVQSSGTAIELGPAMAPLMDSADLHQWLLASGIDRARDAPAEVYLYRWIDQAQGPMIFEVGAPVSADARLPDAAVENPRGYRISRLPALKVASIIYEGPFPHEQGSGWQHIRWEERAREAGLRYTQRLYRELYHGYDYDTGRHITEIQIEIE